MKEENVDGGATQPERVPVQVRWDAVADRLNADFLQRYGSASEEELMALADEAIAESRADRRWGERTGE